MRLRSPLLALSGSRPTVGLLTAESEKELVFTDDLEQILSIKGAGSRQSPRLEDIEAGARVACHEFKGPGGDNAESKQK